MSNKAIKGGRVPKLRFPEFRDAPGWEEETLGTKVTKVGSGITPKGGDRNYKKEGRPFLRSQNIGWGHLILDDVAFIDKETHSTFSATEIREHDVFLNITGASIGRSAVATAQVEGGNVNQHVCIIRTKRPQLNPYFLNQYLLSKYGQAQIDSFQAGGNRQGLNFSQVRSFSIPLPIKDEQKQIADCLSSIDEFITAQTQILDVLKAHKKGLMQQLFPAEGETLPKLRFPEFRDAPEWEYKPIGEMGEVITGSTPSTADTANYGGNRLFVSPADISDERYITKTKTTLTDQGFKKARRIKANSILFVCIGSTIGKVALTKVDCTTNQQINSVVPFCGYSAKFIYAALLNKSRDIAALAGKQAVPIINKTLFSSVQLCRPKLPEQQRIGDFLSSIDDLITSQTQKIETLKAHKKGLMQQLFPAADGESG